MRQEVKVFVVTLVSVFLAMELRSFLEKGGGNNELAMSLLKILFWAGIGVLVLNFDDASRVMVNNLENLNGETLVKGTVSLAKLISGNRQ